MNDWRRNVLFFAPHADDEALGAGGLLASLKAQACVVICALGRPFGDMRPNLEQTNAEFQAARDVLLTRARILFTERQGHLDLLGQSALVNAFDAIIDSERPSAVFLPYASHHQDHRAVYEAGLAALRPRATTMGIELVALYEYPYASTWPAPDLPGGKFHFALSPDLFEKKMAACAAYRRLAEPGAWLSKERVEAWTRMRGAEVGVEMAEAFWVVRGWL